MIDILPDCIEISKKSGLVVGCHVIELIWSAHCIERVIFGTDLAMKKSVVSGPESNEFSEAAFLMAAIV